MKIIDIKEYIKKLKQLKELNKSVNPLFERMNEDKKQLKLKNNKLNYNN